MSLLLAEIPSEKAVVFTVITKKEFNVGDTVAVKYNPDKPEEFLVNGKSSGKGFGIALLLFGLVIIAIAFTQR